MLTYRNHKQIPVKFRRVILDETNMKRIAKVPITQCNEIIEEYLQEEFEDATLKNYQIESLKNGVHNSVDVNNRQSALVEVDRILDYGEYDGTGVYIAVRQAGRLIAGYANGEWVDVPSKDALRRVRRS